MFVRLFRLAGRQYEIEAWVIRQLESFLPGDFSETFEQNNADFTASDQINQKWAEAAPRSELQVFVLPANKSSWIVTRLGKLVLPQVFARMKDDFETFYGKLNEPRNVYFTWIYEDNLVHIQLKTDKCDITLSLPLLLGVLLAVVDSAREITLSDLVQAMALNENVVNFLLKRVTSDSPLLHWCTDVDSGEQMLQFNRAFEMKTKKLTFALPQFSLATAPKLDLQGVQPIITTQGIYQSSIMAILKKRKQIVDHELMQLARPVIAQHCDFDAVHFDEAIAYLLKRQYGKRNPKQPHLLEYVAE
jgi:hypothetical protein